MPEPLDLRAGAEVAHTFAPEVGAVRIRAVDADGRSGTTGSVDTRLLPNRP